MNEQMNEQPRGMDEIEIPERKAIYMDVITTWGKSRADEIAKKYNVKPSIIQGVATRLRKLGIALPKLSRATWITEDDLADFRKAFANR